MYLGTVVQHLTHGMLKVYIQGIYPEDYAYKPENLPTCLQIAPQFGGSCNGNGTFSYPNIGSTVVCFFANGDQNYPITIGSLLGGDNAFGQYELIKTNDELCSTRHLITAGKSHYEMYESGKISAIVVDPIRTEANVQREYTVDSPLSIDAVSSRPTCELIDSDQISNINCQYVLDNSSNHGAISATTHWFDPESYTKSTTISTENKQMFEKKNGSISTDSYSVVDNDGHREFCQLSVVNGQFNSSETTQEYSKSDVTSMDITAKNTLLHNIDGTFLAHSQYSGNDSVNHNDSVAGDALQRNRKMKASSSLQFKRDTSFCLSGEVNQTKVESKTNPQMQSTVSLKELNQSALCADGKNNVTITTLSSSRMLEANQTMGIQRNNVHNAKATFLQSSHNGFQLMSDWKDDDMMVIGGTSSQEKSNNFTHIEFNSGKDPSISMMSQRKVKKMISGSSQDYNVVCESTLSPTDGSVFVKITDKITKMGCTFEMDSDGNLKISATTSISIDAPTVNITGQSMTQTFSNFTQNAQMMMINGLNGDCRIKNVSLLNHKHQETQSGDIVHPQPTKIATQSN